MCVYVCVLNVMFVLACVLNVMFVLACVCGCVWVCLYACPCENMRLMKSRDPMRTAGNHLEPIDWRK